MGPDSGVGQATRVTPAWMAHRDESAAQVPGMAEGGLGDTGGADVPNAMGPAHALFVQHANGEGPPS
jgi:hypothetical protein